MPTSPPYLRIAGELRRRIDAGELRPGDPLPSTRALARRWRVALATAAHALKVLADEGVVRTMPRVGTVVASARGQRERESELTRERIVGAAIAIADAEGLPALSMRGVAARLGVPVMTLYGRVDGKEALLRLAVDAALGEGTLPDSFPSGWRAQLEVLARSQWRVFQRHPWLVRVLGVTRPSPLPNAIAHAERVLRALAVHGLEAAARMRLHIILHGYIQGLAVNLEAEAEAASATGMSEEAWMRSQRADFAALAASGRYPAFAAVIAELDGRFKLDLDEVFEQGLRVLLDGMAPIVERRSRASRRESEGG